VQTLHAISLAQRRMRRDFVAMVSMQKKAATPATCFTAGIGDAAMCPELEQSP
jgi:hypothetical protein